MGPTPDLSGGGGGLTRSIGRMSPVSRGRKSKKAKSGKVSKSPARQMSAVRRNDDIMPLGGKQSVLEVLRDLLGPKRAPGWFDASAEAVLGRADVLVAARGPRELEQATAELLGEELYRILTGDNLGLLFSGWAMRLIEMAEARILEALGQGGGDETWEAPLRLLHGLTSIGAAEEAVDRVSQAMGDAAWRQPSWLELMRCVAATGEVWQLRDAYGSRIGVIAGVTYPDGADPSVFLFDLDACAFVDLAYAGVFDDVPQAAAAWRALVGHAADGAQPQPVEDTASLSCLAHWDTSEMNIREFESRAAIDNWFRARRRLFDVANALQRRRMPLPVARSLFRDIDATPLANAFTDWYRRRHGADPDDEIVAVLAHEWLARALPETQYAASPHRAKYHLILINDWVSDDPVTIGAKALLPEWVRWNAEQSDLPADLIDHAVAVAAGAPLADTDCPGAGADRG